MRTRMPLDVRREQLLDAGMALFARRSWEETSIDEIALACGVSRGLLYHYFRGKRAYYIETIAHAVKRLQAVEPGLALAPTDQLRVGLERYFVSLREHPDAHRALRRVPPADEEVAAIVEHDRQAFAERVLAGLPSGGSGSALARATARAWIGAVEAAGLDWLDRPEVPSEQLILVLADALLAGMLAAARIDPTIELPGAVAAIGRRGILDAIAQTRADRATAKPPGA